MKRFPILWGLTVAWIACLMAGVGVVVEWWLSFRRQWPVAATWAPNGLALAACMGVVYRCRTARRVDARRMRSAVALIAVTVCVLFLIRLPVERIHLVQYGVLAVLCERAIRDEAVGYLRPTARGISARAIPWCVLGLVVCVACAEEGLQSLMPGRFAVAGDVGLDVLGGVLGLWGVSLWRREQEHYAVS